MKDVSRCGVLGLLIAALLSSFCALGGDYEYRSDFASDDPGLQDAYTGYRRTDGMPQSVLLSYYDGPDTRGFAWQTDLSQTTGKLWLLSGSFGSSADASFATNLIMTAASVKHTECYAHLAQVTGLKRGTYSYRLGDSGHYTYGTFTVDPTPDSFTMLNVNDIQNRDNDKIDCWDRTVAAAASVLGGPSGVDMVISGGDFIEGNSEPDYVEWGVVVDKALPVCADVPWTMASGNHDASMYGKCINENFQHRVSGHYGCHSFDVGNVHIVSLPYYGSWNDSVNTWLTNDLSSCTSQWRIVSMHFGPYTTVDNGCNASENYVKTVAGIFKDGKVDLVLQAHDHGYSKTLPYLWSGNGYAMSESDKAATVNVSPTVESIGGESYYKDPMGTVYISAGCAGHRVGEGMSYATSTYRNRGTKIFVDTIKVGENAGNDATLVPDKQMFGVLKIEGDKLAYNWYLAEANGTATLFDTLRIYKTAASGESDPGPIDDPDPGPVDDPDPVNVTVTAVAAQQRYPWNGLVDITVTFSGASNDVARTACEFFVTNTATQARLPFGYVHREGDDLGSGNVWTRRYVWDAGADVGAVKIDDVVLAVRPSTGGVQLWEGGPYWAECNVGAKSPEESGYFFSWGGTAVNSGSAFTGANCPTFGKSASGLESSGYLDASGNLKAAYDAAAVHLGSPWRMPTAAEYEALMANCTSEWTERFGVCGRLLKGTGDYASRSVFFPASGFGEGTSLSEVGGLGRYWSSTPETGMIEGGRNLLFTQYLLTRVSVSRYFGQNVRAVRGAASGIGTSASVAAHLGLDCRTGIRIANATEHIRFSPSWASSANGALATVKLDGVTVASRAESGTYDWTPARAGLYRFTHTVTAAGNAVGDTESVTFAVGVPDVESLYGTAANGKRVIDCFLAGINPAGTGTDDSPSELLALIETVGDEVSISWTPDLNDGKTARTYSVLGCDDLGTLQWEEVRPWHHFFKVVATMPDGVEDSAFSGMSFVPQVKPQLSGVQLWEGGPCWAEWNVGAMMPEGSGYLFSWGDTAGYRYADATWIAGNGMCPEEGPFWGRNCPTYTRSQSELQELGYVDSSGTLVGAHDAAATVCGAPWRMPTDADFAALVINCDWERTTRDGVNGVLVKGRGEYASASVFFPACGYGHESTYCNPNAFGRYWTSSAGNGFDAVQYIFSDGGFSRNSNWQNQGAAVRPVRDAE